MSTDTNIPLPPVASTAAVAASTAPAGSETTPTFNATVAGALGATPEAHAAILRMAADSAERRGDLARAAEYLTRSLAIWPWSPEVETRLEELLGRIESDHPDSTEDARSYRAALDLGEVA